MRRSHEDDADGRCQDVAIDRLGLACENEGLKGQRPTEYRAGTRTDLLDHDTTKTVCNKDKGPVLLLRRLLSVPKREARQLS